MADPTVPPEALTAEQQAAAQQQQSMQESAAWLLQNRPELVNRPNPTAEAAAAANLAYQTNTAPRLPEYGNPVAGMDYSNVSQVERANIYNSGGNVRNDLILVWDTRGLSDPTNQQGTPRYLSPSEYRSEFGISESNAAILKHDVSWSPRGISMEDVAARYDAGHSPQTSIISTYEMYRRDATNDYFRNVRQSDEFRNITAQYDLQQNRVVGGAGVMYQGEPAVHNPYIGTVLEDSAASIAWDVGRVGGSDTRLNYIAEAERVWYNKEYNQNIDSGFIRYATDLYYNRPALQQEDFTSKTGQQFTNEYWAGGPIRMNLTAAEIASGGGVTKENYQSYLSYNPETRSYEQVRSPSVLIGFETGVHTAPGDWGGPVYAGGYREGGSSYPKPPVMEGVPLSIRGANTAETLSNAGITLLGDQSAVTTYVPYGSYTQEQLLNTKLGISRETGELAIYQYSERFGTWGLIGGGGRNALQSGMFTVGKASTPYVVMQSDIGTYERPGITKTENLSRLGAEAYGGQVRNLTPTNLLFSDEGMARYFGAGDNNLANLVNPVASSKSVAPGASIPWSVSPYSPSMQYMDKSGFTGEAINARGNVFAEYTISTTRAEAVASNRGADLGTFRGLQVVSLEKIEAPSYPSNPETFTQVKSESWLYGVPVVGGIAGSMDAVIGLTRATFNAAGIPTNTLLTLGEWQERDLPTSKFPIMGGFADVYQVKSTARESDAFMRRPSEDPITGGASYTGRLIGPEGTPVTAMWINSEPVVTKGTPVTTFSYDASGNIVRTTVTPTSTSYQRQWVDLDAPRKIIPSTVSAERLRGSDWNAFQKQFSKDTYGKYLPENISIRQFGLDQSNPVVAAWTFNTDVMQSGYKYAKEHPFNMAGLAVEMYVGGYVFGKLDTGFKMAEAASTGLAEGSLLIPVAKAASFTYRNVIPTVFLGMMGRDIAETATARGTDYSSEGVSSRLGPKLVDTSIMLAFIGAGMHQATRGANIPEGTPRWAGDRLPGDWELTPPGGRSSGGGGGWGGRSPPDNPVASGHWRTMDNTYLSMIERLTYDSTRMAPGDVISMDTLSRWEYRHGYTSTKPAARSQFGGRNPATPFEDVRATVDNFQRGAGATAGGKPVDVLSQKMLEIYGTTEPRFYEEATRKSIADQMLSDNAVRLSTEQGIQLRRFPYEDATVGFRESPAGVTVTIPQLAAGENYARLGSSWFGQKRISTPEVRGLLPEGEGEIRISYSRLTKARADLIPDTEFNYLRNMAKDQGFHRIYAEQGDEIVGGLSYGFMELGNKFGEDRHISIFFMEVLPKGSGVGSKIVSALDQIAVDRKVRTITGSALESAVGFWEKQGFEIVKKNDYGLYDIEKVYEERGFTLVGKPYSIEDFYTRKFYGSPPSEDLNLLYTQRYGGVADLNQKLLPAAGQTASIWNQPIDIETNINWLKFREQPVLDKFAAVQGELKWKPVEFNQEQLNRMQFENHQTLTTLTEYREMQLTDLFVREDREIGAFFGQEPGVEGVLIGWNIGNPSKKGHLSVSFSAMYPDVGRFRKQYSAGSEINPESLFYSSGVQWTPWVKRNNIISGVSLHTHPRTWEKGEISAGYHSGRDVMLVAKDFMDAHRGYDPIKFVREDVGFVGFDKPMLYETSVVEAVMMKQIADGGNLKSTSRSINVSFGKNRKAFQAEVTRPAGLKDYGTEWMAGVINLHRRTQVKYGWPTEIKALSETPGVFRIDEAGELKLIEPKVEEGFKSPRYSGEIKKYITLADVSKGSNWGEIQYTHKKERSLLKGVIEDRSIIPETLYHVTTNLPVVLEEGVLRHMPGGVGLGKGSSVAHHGVSLTSSLSDALLIQREVLRTVEIAHGRDFDTALQEYVWEDEEAIGGRLKTLRGGVLENYNFRIGLGNKYDNPFWMEDAGIESLLDYRVSRDRVTNGRLQDPIIFGRADVFSKIPEENVGIVTVRKSDIPSDVLLRDPLGGFMHEVMVHSDVSIAGEFEKAYPVNAPLQEVTIGGYVLEHVSTRHLFSGGKYEGWTSIQGKNLYDEVQATKFQNALAHDFAQRAVLKGSQGLVIARTPEGKLAGVTNFYYRESGDYLNAEYMATVERGKGAGSAMVEYLEQFAGKIGKKGLIGEPYPSAMSYWESKGWKSKGKDWNGLWSKELEFKKPSYSGSIQRPATESEILEMIRPTKRVATEEEIIRSIWPRQEVAEDMMLRKPEYKGEVNLGKYPASPIVWDSGVAWNTARSEFSAVQYDINTMATGKIPVNEMQQTTRLTWMTPLEMRGKQIEMFEQYPGNESALKTFNMRREFNPNYSVEELKESMMSFRSGAVFAPLTLFYDRFGKIDWTVQEGAHRTHALIDLKAEHIPVWETYQRGIERGRNYELLPEARQVLETRPSYKIGMHPRLGEEAIIEGFRKPKYAGDILFTGRAEGIPQEASARQLETMRGISDVLVPGEKEALFIFDRTSGELVARGTGRSSSTIGMGTVYKAYESIPDVSRGNLAFYHTHPWTTAVAGELKPEAIEYMGSRKAYPSANDILNIGSSYPFTKSAMFAEEGIIAPGRHITTWRGMKRPDYPDALFRPVSPEALDKIYLASHEPRRFQIEMARVGLDTQIIVGETKDVHLSPLSDVPQRTFFGIPKDVTYAPLPRDYRQTIPWGSDLDRALTLYGRDFYKPLNAIMRGNEAKYFPEQNSVFSVRQSSITKGDALQAISTMRMEIDRYGVEIPEGTTLYRGVPADSRIASKILSMKPGDAYSDTAFQSFSTSARYASIFAGDKVNGVILKYAAETGVKGYTPNHMVNEVTLLPGRFAIANTYDVPRKSIAEAIYEDQNEDVVTRVAELSGFVPEFRKPRYAGEVSWGTELKEPLRPKSLTDLKDFVEINRGYTPSEFSAIRTYTNPNASTGFQMNALVYAGINPKFESYGGSAMMPRAEVRPRLANEIPALESAFARQVAPPLNEHEFFYRGINLDEVVESSGLKIPAGELPSTGDILMMRGFVSTTLSPARAIGYSKFYEYAKPNVWGGKMNVLPILAIKPTTETPVIYSRDQLEVILQKHSMLEVSKSYLKSFDGLMDTLSGAQHGITKKDEAFSDYRFLYGEKNILVIEANYKWVSEERQRRIFENVDSFQKPSAPLGLSSGKDLPTVPGIPQMPDKYGYLKKAPEIERFLRRGLDSNTGIERFAIVSKEGQIKKFGIGEVGGVPMRSLGDDILTTGLGSDVFIHTHPKFHEDTNFAAINKYPSSEDISAFIALGAKKYEIYHNAGVTTVELPDSLVRNGNLPDIHLQAVRGHGHRVAEIFEDMFASNVARLGYTKWDEVPSHVVEQQYSLVLASIEQRTGIKVRISPYEEMTGVASEVIPGATDLMQGHYGGGESFRKPSMRGSIGEGYIPDESRYAALEAMLNPPEAPLLEMTKALTVPSRFEFRTFRQSSAAVNVGRGTVTLGQQIRMTGDVSTPARTAKMIYEISELEVPITDMPAWSVIGTQAISARTSTVATLDPFSGEFYENVTKTFKLSPRPKIKITGYEGEQFAYGLNIYDLPVRTDVGSVTPPQAPDVNAMSMAKFTEKRGIGTVDITARRTVGTYGEVERGFVRQEGNLALERVVLESRKTRQINKAFTTLTESEVPVDVLFNFLEKGAPRPNVVRAAQERAIAAEEGRKWADASRTLTPQKIIKPGKSTAKKSSSGGSGTTMEEVNVSLADRAKSISRNIIADITPIHSKKNYVTPESAADAMAYARTAHKVTIAENIERFGKSSREQTGDLFKHGTTLPWKRITPTSAGIAMRNAREAQKETVARNKVFVGDQIKDILRGAGGIHTQETIVDTSAMAQYNNAMFTAMRKDARQREMASLRREDTYYDPMLKVMRSTRTGREVSASEREINSILSRSGSRDLDIRGIVGLQREQRSMTMMNESMATLLNTDDASKMERRYIIDDVVRDLSRTAVGADIAQKVSRDELRWVDQIPGRDVVSLQKQDQQQITDQVIEQITKPDTIWEWERLPPPPDIPKFPSGGIGAGGGGGGWPTWMQRTNKYNYKNPVIDIDYLNTLPSRFGAMGMKSGNILSQFRRR